MIKFLRITLLVMVVISGFYMTSYGQQEVQVNQAKGLMSVDIPVHSFDFPGFKVPLGYKYLARGFKVNNPSTSTYDGWSFYGGGTIKRIVRGLPDQHDETNRKGWNTTTLYTVPPAFTPADDNDENVCTDEATNNTWLNTNYTGKDLQPDVFVVEAPGLSCRLMKDNLGVYRAIPAQELKVEVVVVALNNIDFIITTNAGVKYTFDLNSAASKTLYSSGISYDLFGEEATNYNTTIAYADVWYLRRIDIQSEGKANYMVYEYLTNIYKSNLEQLKILVKDGAIDTARESTLYEWSRSSSNRHFLKSMTSSLGSKAVFSGTEDTPSDISIYYSLAIDAPVAKNVSVGNNLAYNSDETLGHRQFASSISFSEGCSGKKYLFDYYGVTPVGETGPSAFTINRNSKKTDAWGFLNGSTGASPAPRIYVYPALRATTGAYRPYPIPGYAGTSYILPGNDKTPNENTIAYGTMSKITYPYGGNSSFEYECNSFLDQDANAEVKGGGIRIKAINHFDGFNTSTVMRKEFIYKTDAGITSGIINMLPAYAISTPSYKNPVNGDTRTYSNIVSSFGINSLNYWNYLTVRTKHDLYMGESAVTYTQVTTKETGNGKVKQVFSPTKSFWDTSTSVLSYAAEACSGSNSTFIIKGYNQYPFSPVEHWYGGELLEESIYNEAGNLLKKTEYEYENYHSSPQRIYAIQKDTNLGLRQFSKYFIEIGGHLLKKSKETVYDSNLTGNSQLTQVDYDNSAFNRKIRSTLQTNSDLTQIRKKYLYTGDFSSFHTSDQSNAFLDGLATLSTLNLRDNIVEETTELKPGGVGSFKMIAAKAKLFNGITIGSIKYPLLKEIRTLDHFDGLTDFVPMQITGSTPSRALSVDSRYKAEQVYGDFSNYFLPSVITEKRTKTLLINDSLLRVPMLSVSNADLADVGFNNFDRMDRQSLSLSNSAWASYFQDPYFGRYVRFVPGTTIGKAFTRKTENKFYKICFIARADTARQINILINGSVVSTITIPITSRFRFYEKMIDLSAVTTGTFTMNTNGNAYVDNLLFYPAESNWTAANYEPVYGKIMEMTSSGVVNCYDYAIGQLSAERNIEGNLTKAFFVNKFILGSIIPFYPNITVLNPTKTFVGREMKFRGGGTCMPGTKYMWNFGDGSTLETYERDVSHVFASAATFTVSLTIQHPERTNQATTQNLVIQPAPVLSEFSCVSGVVRINTCNPLIKFYETCPGLPPGNIDSPNGTKFLVFASGCPTGTLAYQWEKSYDGVNYWDISPYTTGTQLYMQEQAYMQDTWIRCKITAIDCDLVIYSTPVFIEANCGVN